MIWFVRPYLEENRIHVQDKKTTLLNSWNFAFLFFYWPVIICVVKRIQKSLKIWSDISMWSIHNCFILVWAFSIVVCLYCVLQTRRHLLLCQISWKPKTEQNRTEVLVFEKSINATMSYTYIQYSMTKSNVFH